MVVSLKTKHTLNIQPGHHTPRCFLKVLKTYACTKLCTWMFIAAFFLIIKTWEQLRCPSVGDWMNKL
jgi:hypothetical protein